MYSALLGTRHCLSNPALSEAHLVPLLCCHNALVCRLAAHCAEVKPALEVCQAGEDVWQQEVEQAPQFTQVVLQGGAWGEAWMCDGVGGEEGGCQRLNMAMPK